MPIVMHICNLQKVFSLFSLNFIIIGTTFSHVSSERNFSLSKHSSTDASYGPGLENPTLFEN